VVVSETGKSFDPPNGAIVGSTGVNNLNFSQLVYCNVSSNNSKATTHRRLSIYPVTPATDPVTPQITFPPRSKESHERSGESEIVALLLNPLAGKATLGLIKAAQLLFI